MAKYLVELALLMRHTALVVVESDHEPDRSDLREAYQRYEEDDWDEDPNWSEEGTPSVQGEIVDGQLPGFTNIEALPIIKLEDSDD
jgi:hypothetical protein